MGPTRWTCATLPLRWGSGNRFHLDQQRAFPRTTEGFPLFFPASALPWEVGLRVVATTKWLYHERRSASSQPEVASLSHQGWGLLPLKHFSRRKKQMNGRFGRSFYQRIFNITNHCVLQAFPSTLKISPKFSSYFNSCNFPSPPEIKLAAREEQRASVNTIFICCYCYSFINL